MRDSNGVFHARILIVTLAVASIAGCKVAGRDDKRSTAPAETVVAMMSYLSYATAEDVPTFGDSKGNTYSTSRELNSMFQGQALIAEAGSSLAEAERPANGCRLASQPSGASIAGLRALDIGDLRVTGGGVDAALPKDSQNLSFGYFLPLPFGRYDVVNEAHPAALAIRHSLSVLEPATSIFVHSGAYENQLLPPLGSVSPSDRDWYIVVERGSGMTLSLQAPVGASYVVVELFDGQYIDGRPNAASTIVCVASPGETIHAPAELFGNFMATGDASTSMATLTVDVVATDRKTNQGRVTDSLIRSFTRHGHGPVPLWVMDQNGKRSQVYSPFGTVIIR